MEDSRAFAYPPEPHVRKHEPCGYSDYESYRDWLRDEFTFRCVLCLRREKWSVRRAAFHIDHLVARSQAPDRICDYTNLIYVCASCNSVKGDLVVPDPCQVGFGRCVSVDRQGHIEALNDKGAVLIDVLRLDDADQTRYRKMILDLLDLATRNNERHLVVQLMGFPEHLPDLARKRCPENRHPEGVRLSCFARKQRNELPETY